MRSSIFSLKLVFVLIFDFFVLYITFWSWYYQLAAFCLVVYYYSYLFIALAALAAYLFYLAPCYGTWQREWELLLRPICYLIFGLVGCLSPVLWSCASPALAHALYVAFSIFGVMSSFLRFTYRRHYLARAGVVPIPRANMQPRAKRLLICYLST
jgi:hypothetical protein